MVLSGSAPDRLEVPIPAASDRKSEGQGLLRKKTTQRGKGFSLPTFFSALMSEGVVHRQSLRGYGRACAGDDGASRQPNRPRHGSCLSAPVFSLLPAPAGLGKKLVYLTCA